MSIKSKENVFFSTAWKSVNWFLVGKVTIIGVLKVCYRIRHGLRDKDVQGIKYSFLIDFLFEFIAFELTGIRNSSTVLW